MGCSTLARMIIVTTEGLLDANDMFFQGAGDQRWVTKTPQNTPQFHPKAPFQHWKNAPRFFTNVLDCAGQLAETFMQYKKSFPSTKKKTG